LIEVLVLGEIRAASNSIQVESGFPAIAYDKMPYPEK